MKESDFEYKKQQLELSNQLYDLFKGDEESDYELEGNPRSNLIEHIDEDESINKESATDTLIFHIELLTLRMGKNPYPSRYPVTGYYEQANFGFIKSTIESFADWLEPRCRAQLSNQYESKPPTPSPRPSPHGRGRKM